MRTRKISDDASHGKKEKVNKQNKKKKKKKRPDSDKLRTGKSAMTTPHKVRTRKTEIATKNA